MQPRKPAVEAAVKREQDDLFRSRLDAIIDPRHSLVQLGKAIDWSVFDTAFGNLFDQTNGRPGSPAYRQSGSTLIADTGDTTRPKKKRCSSPAKKPTQRTA